MSGAHNSAALTDAQIDAIARDHFIRNQGDDPEQWGPNSLNQQWMDAIGRPFARAILAHVSGEEPSCQQANSQQTPTAKER